MSVSASEVILRFYQGFLSGNEEQVSATADDGTTWYIEGRSQLAGEHKGTQGILALRGKAFMLTGGTLRAMRQNTVDVAASSSHAYLMDALLAEREGKDLLSYVALVAHVSDGRLQEIHTFWENQHAFDEFFA